MLYHRLIWCLSEGEFDTQDRIVGIVGAVAVLLVVLLILRRLMFGKAKTIIPTDEQAIECPHCRYFLVPTDTVCPKCHKPVPAKSQQQIDKTSD